MTEILAPYSHSHFHSLPTVRDAHDAFTRADGDRHVGGCLRDLFVRHNMDRRFGLAMMHRHFDLEPGERLVEYIGTSTPWNMGADDEAEGRSGGGTKTTTAAAAGLLREPRPSMWGFDQQGRLRPTEYRYSGTDDDDYDDGSSRDGGLADDPQVRAFVADLRGALEERGLGALFGLARYPGDDFRGSCEFTQGRSNINLLPKDYPPDLRAFSTIWYFSPPLWELRCNCKCNEITEIHTHSHRWVV